MQDILDDIVQPQEKRIYAHASKGQRFANYIIDMIAVSLIGMVITDVFGITFLETDDPDEMIENFSAGLFFMEWLLSLVQILAYYTAMEYWLQGKSLGKYITNTRAVTLYNERLDLNDALIRSLCRLIPFEAFSFLGSGPSGWHDTIPKTKVIKDEGWIDEDEYL